MEKSDVEEWTNCKACKKMIKAKSIITHLSRLTKCRDVYGSEFDDMIVKRDLKRKKYLDGDIKMVISRWMVIPKWCDECMVVYGAGTVTMVWG